MSLGVGRKWIFKEADECSGCCIPQLSRAFPNLRSEGTCRRERRQRSETHGCRSASPSLCGSPRGLLLVSAISAERPSGVKGDRADPILSFSLPGVKRLAGFSSSTAGDFVFAAGEDRLSIRRKEKEKKRRKRRQKEKKEEEKKRREESKKKKRRKRKKRKRERRRRKRRRRKEKRREEKEKKRKEERKE